MWNKLMLGCRYAPMVCAFSSKQIGEYHRLGRQSLIMSSTSDLTDNNLSRNIIRNILIYIYIYVHIMISIFLIISPCHTSWPSSCRQSWLALYFFSGFPKAHQRSGSGCLRFLSSMGPSSSIFQAAWCCWRSRDCKRAGDVVRTPRRILCKVPLEARE